jgi:hypothetical protein
MEHSRAPGGGITGGAIGWTSGGAIGQTAGGQMGAISIGFEQTARILPSTQRHAHSARAGPEAGPAAETSQAPASRSGKNSRGARPGEWLGNGERIALPPMGAAVFCPFPRPPAHGGAAEEAAAQEGA